MAINCIDNPFCIGYNRIFCRQLIPAQTRLNTGYAV